MYEPLIVPPGRARTVPWLARSWKWTNGNKTLTLHIATNAKWSDGKALTAADVAYSLTAGRQDKTMDRIGLTGAGNNIASINAKGAHTVVIKLKAADSQFIAATLNRASSCRSTSGRRSRIPRRSRTRTRQLRPVQRDHAFTTQDYVLGKNPHYWQQGLPKVACLEYV